MVLRHGMLRLKSLTNPISRILDVAVGFVTISNDNRHLPDNYDRQNR